MDSKEIYIRLLSSVRYSYSTSNTIDMCNIQKEKDVNYEWDWEDEEEVDADKGKTEWISILLSVVQDVQKADGNIVLSCLEAALHALRQQFPHDNK